MYINFSNALSLGAILSNALPLYEKSPGDFKFARKQENLFDK